MKFKIITVCLLLAALIFSNIRLNDHKKSDILINDLIPKQIKNWSSKELTTCDATFSMIGREELLLRLYKQKGYNNPITLGIVYTNKRDHIHNPENCYLGQGFDNFKKSQILLDNKYPVNLLKSKRNRKDHYTIFWYTEKNKTFPDKAAFMRKIIKNKFFDDQTGGFAVVTLTLRYEKAEDLEKLKDLSSEVNTILLKTEKENVLNENINRK